AGYPLPAELRLPIELTLARHLRDDLVAVAERHDTGALASAAHTVADAVEAGVHLALPDVQVAATAALEAVVARAVAERSRSSVLLAEGLLDLLATAGIEASLDRAQEDVYAALTAG